MNRTDISPRFVALIFTSVLFVFLFYNAPMPGINWLVYALNGAILTYFFVAPERKSNLLFPSAMLITSVVGVFVQNTDLSIAAALVSFTFLSARIVAPQIDSFLGVGFGFINLILSPLTALIRLFQGSNSKEKTTRRLFIKAFIPGALVLLFGILYYDSSPTFKELVNRFRWTDFPAFAFTAIIGLFLGTTLFYSFIPKIKRKESAQERSDWSKAMGSDLQYSWKLGIWSLCVLLLFVISVDLFHWLNGQLPPGMTYAEYLHQGVFSLIASIVFSAAISILTSNYTSDQPSRSMKISNYIFIGLNVVYVVQNFVRNSLYVGHYGLTEKRMIIYGYFILCLVGLGLTVFSIHRNRSIRFLYRSCTNSVLIMVVASSLFNWSIFITKYNLNNPNRTVGVDYDYLLELNQSNIPLLYENRKNLSTEQREILDYRITAWSYKALPSDLREFQLSDYLTHNRLKKMGAFDHTPSLQYKRYE